METLTQIVERERSASDIVTYVSKGMGSDCMIMNVMNLAPVHALVRFGRGEPERTYVVSKDQYGELLKAELRLDEAEKKLEQFALPVLKVGHIEAPESATAGRVAPMGANTDKKDAKKDDKKQETTGSKNSVENLKPSTPEEENSLQTAAESVFAIDPQIAERVKEMFSTSDFCKNKDKDSLDETHTMKFKHPTFGFEIERPIFSRTFACLNTGDVILTQSIEHHYFDLALIDPKAGGKMVINTFTTSVENNQELFVQKIAESTKIGFGSGFNIAPVPIPNIPNPLTVKEGDPAFEKNKPKQEPGTNKQISFNLELQKQYFELTLRALARFKLIHKLQNPPVVIPLS